MELHQVVVLVVVVHPAWAEPFTMIFLDLVVSATAPLAQIRLKVAGEEMELIIKALVLHKVLVAQVVAREELAAETAALEPQETGAAEVVVADQFLALVVLAVLAAAVEAAALALGAEMLVRVALADNMAVLADKVAALEVLEVVVAPD